MPIHIFSKAPDAERSDLMPKHQSAPEIKQEKSFSDAPSALSLKKYAPPWLNPKPAASARSSAKLYMEEISPQDLTPEEWDKIHVCGIFSRAIYKGDWEKIFHERGLNPESWNVVKLEDIAEISEKLPSLQSSLEEDGRYLDYETGMVAQVTQNHADKEIIVTFGPSTVGEYKGELVDRSKENKKMSLKHWEANIGNLLSHHYREIHERGRILTQIFATRYPGHQVYVDGVSLGAIIAEVAALSTIAKIPVKALSFCTPKLGTPGENLICEKNPNADAGNVLHLLLEDDVVPKLGLWGSHLGRIVRVPASKNLPSASAKLPRSVAVHEEFDTSVNEFYAVRGGNAGLIK